MKKIHGCAKQELAGHIPNSKVVNAQCDCKTEGNGRKKWNITSLSRSSPWFAKQISIPDNDVMTKQTVKCSNTCVQTNSITVGCHHHSCETNQHYSQNFCKSWRKTYTSAFSEGKFLCLFILHSVLY